MSNVEGPLTKIAIKGNFYNSIKLFGYVLCNI